MSASFVVIDGDLDRPTRLRKAILGMSATEKFAPPITSKDVQRVWTQIGKSGYCPRSIANIANDKDVEPPLFVLFMECLNSYL
ncbi:hypothetical protein ACI45T_002409 [Vibrio vulnificus]|nr:hypothetical protein [Vibrio vulnificus]